MANNTNTAFVFEEETIDNNIYHINNFAIERFYIKKIPIWKRTIDVFGSIIGLILLIPVMACIALAIKLTSKGPVLFKQKRAGLGGRPFVFYKFRSMIIDAEEKKKDLVDFNERSGPVFKMKKDPRNYKNRKNYTKLESR